MKQWDFIRISETLTMVWWWHLINYGLRTSSMPWSKKLLPPYLKRVCLSVSVNHLRPPSLSDWQLRLQIWLIFCLLIWSLAEDHPWSRSYLLLCQTLDLIQFFPKWFLDLFWFAANEELTVVETFFSLRRIASATRLISMCLPFKRRCKPCSLKNCLGIESRSTNWAWS